MLIYNSSYKQLNYMGQHIFKLAKNFVRKKAMEEKRFIFKIEEGYSRIVIWNGEIISIESHSREYNDKEVDEKLKLASQDDLEKFLELFQSLRMDSSHYKKCKRILRERKKELEESIQKINRMLLG